MICLIIHVIEAPFDAVRLNHVRAAPLSSSLSMRSFCTDGVDPSHYRSAMTSGMDRERMKSAHSM